jgi:predicted ArsR family transcriptional regulator
MEAMLEIFSGAEVIADWPREGSKGTGALIVDLLARRPCTLEELAALTALHRNEILKYLEVLETAGKISRLRHRGVLYFQAPDR